MPDFIQKPPHMLIHPHFNPIAVQIGKVAIHWYGLMYLIGFLLFLALGRMRIKRGRPAGWQLSELDDLLFYGVLGVILGGRLGYVFFYKPDFLPGPPARYRQGVGRRHVVPRWFYRRAGSRVGVCA